MAKSSSVFISYSHDSDWHAKAVLDLANTLREDGVDARLDRFVESPPEGWPRWVQSQIEGCDFVICVCTPAYRTSFEGRNDPALGLGVNQEGFLILQDLYDHGNTSRKYIPVTLEGKRTDAVPGPLRGFQRYHLPQEYEDLYRRLTGQPAVVPSPLGGVRKLQPLAVLRGAVTSLDDRSEGFPDQARQDRYITPADYPLQRLAPAEGLFLSRLINPQERAVADLITNAWVAAHGPLDYILYGIRIRDVCRGGLGANPVVAIAPDAEYRFTYLECTDKVHALNPALVVGPSTRPWAWFTVGTAMEEPYYYMGDLYLTIQYHAADGRQGTLVLDEVSESQKRLARIAACEVLVSDSADLETALEPMVITTQGVQRGLEQQSRPDAWFIPVPIPDIKWGRYGGPDRERLLVERETALQAIGVRSALNEALRNPVAIEKLKAWFVEGSPLAGDLLGCLGVPEARDFLRSELSGTRRGSAIEALAVRHIAAADDLLSDAIRKDPGLIASDAGNVVIAALALRPVPGIVEIIELFRNRKSETGKVLLQEVFEDLTGADQTAVLAGPEGPLGCDLYVRGTMNEWQADAAAKLLYESDGIYRAVVSVAPQDEFKIGGSEWWQANYGAYNPGEYVAFGKPTDLNANELSNNFCFSFWPGGKRKMQFQVSAKNPRQLRLVIEELPGELSL